MKQQTTSNGKAMSELRFVTNKRGRRWHLPTLLKSTNDIYMYKWKQIVCTVC